MKACKSAMIEFLIVGVVGLVVGYAVNGLRASDSIRLGRNYFAKGGPTVAGEPDPSASSMAEPTGTDPGQESDDTPHLEHPYQRISFDEVVKIFNDPATASGAAVFVDARNDQAFAAGHIPGAIQADHYRIEDYIDAVLAAVETADKVIVYCNGGDCEDSIYMCKNLIDFDVPYEKIYLYGGGWTEWESKGQPVERNEE